ASARCCLPGSPCAHRIFQTLPPLLSSENRGAGASLPGAWGCPPITPSPPQQRGAGASLPAGALWAAGVSPNSPHSKLKTRAALLFLLALRVGYVVSDYTYVIYARDLLHSRAIIEVHDPDSHYQVPARLHTKC